MQSMRKRISVMKEEQGAVLIIFAFALIMFFALMALAVDTAHAFVERRESQSTVDVSAIGGALILIDNPSDDYNKAIQLVDEVQRISQTNLGAGLDWEACQDGDRPSQFNVVASDVFVLGIDDQYTDCISWASDWSEVRVRVPRRDIGTFFAKVIGIDTIAVGAFAEVNAVVSGNGGVLPFGVLSGHSGGLVCLKTGPQFPIECDPNSSGNFHFLDFRVFGNIALKTTSTGCTGGSVTTLKENIAHGIDHDLAIAPDTPTDDSGIDNDITIIEDNEQCPDTSKKVQAVLTETGNKTKVLIDGFVKGVGAFDGRLTLGSPTYDYNGTDIDDKGLWEYFWTDPLIIHPCAGANTEAAVLSCIANNPGVELFDLSIQNSPRLALVPELWQTTWPNGSKLVSFQSFRFVYVQTLYGGCKNNGTCSLEIEPGASGTKKLTGDDPVVVTAIGIPDLTVPQTVRDSFGTPKVVTYALSR